ncbi:MAG: response regulator [Myxococcota bacterium]|nr:response regulator [Myxococcota bacterium]
MDSRAAILVVDDDRAMCEMLVDQLAMAGFEAAAATALDEALALIGEGVFSLVVSDVDLRAGDGFELLQRIRALGREVPVVLMTSFGSERVARRALEAGAAAFLDKPFGRDDLLTAVAQGLGAVDALNGSAG